MPPFICRIYPTLCAVEKKGKRRKPHAARKRRAPGGSYQESQKKQKPEIPSVALIQYDGQMAVDRAIIVRRQLLRSNGKHAKAAAARLTQLISQLQDIGIRVPWTRSDAERPPLIRWMALDPARGPVWLAIFRPRAPHAARQPAELAFQGILGDIAQRMAERLGLHRRNVSPDSGQSSSQRSPAPICHESTRDRASCVKREHHGAFTPQALCCTFLPG